MCKCAKSIGLRFQLTFYCSMARPNGKDTYLMNHGVCLIINHRVTTLFTVPNQFGDPRFVRDGGQGPNSSYCPTVTVTVT